MAATKRKAAAVDISRAKANGDVLPPLKRKVLLRKVSTTAATVNSDVNVDIFGASNAVRASPYASASGDVRQAQLGRSESPLSDVPDVIEQPKKKGRAGAEKRIQNAQEEVSVATDTTSTAAPKKTGRGRRSKQPDVETVRPSTAAQTAKKSATKKSAEYDMGDPEADGGEEADENEVKAALIRPPPVNSDYLPLPWKGRLGYACLNTYLRQSYPPVFSSRTCRIQSILEHRHPLQDPTKPEHPVKNRPDRSKPVDVELGKRYLEAICLANVRDIAKMIRWNDRYHIRFLRLSSEMFPFASHPEYGYRLAPFAAKALAEAGQVIAHCGHRVTTHPGQFTQLGSPRKQVIDNAVRDLSYHDEMLTLLRLPEQQDKDAVMILHMGGIFEGKQETIARFKQNYAGLPQSVKNRLVLENDDMGWSVHDLLPVCEELNIPLVLDFHHHNIVFDSTQLREGTKDIIDLFPRIAATWARKGIKQKMHYSEPTPSAITPQQRRKHSPRVMMLPPCPPDMDLMIEAKDKEQAVFELMRIFKLPGYDRIADVLPYMRMDDNKAKTVGKRNAGKKKQSGGVESDADESEIALIPEKDVGMGGPEGRVYWPPGMEEWLRPKKREVKKRGPTPEEKTEKNEAQVKKEAAEEAYVVRQASLKQDQVDAEEEEEEEEEEESDVDATPATKKARAAMRKKERLAAEMRTAQEAKKILKAAATAAKNGGHGKKGGVKPKKQESVLTPVASEANVARTTRLNHEIEEDAVPPVKKRRGRQGAAGKKVNGKKLSYTEEGGGDEEMLEA